MFSIRAPLWPVLVFYIYTKPSDLSSIVLLYKRVKLLWAHICLHVGLACMGPGCIAKPRKDTNPDPNIKGSELLKNYRAKLNSQPKQWTLAKRIPLCAKVSCGLERCLPATSSKQLERELMGIKCWYSTIHLVKNNIWIRASSDRDHPPKER